MVIFFEGSALYRNKSGVGYYTYHMLDSLAKLLPGDQLIVFGFLFWGRTAPPVLKQARPNISLRFVRFFPGRIYHNLLRRAVAPPIDLLLGKKPDLYIFPNFVRWPLARRTNSLVVIYDLSYILHGQYSFGNERRYLARKVPAAIAKSSHVVTISENSKREIMSYYGVAANRIIIAPPAIDPATFRPVGAAAITAVKRTYSIKGGYILFTSTIEPRKNVVGLLQAYTKLPEPLRRQYSLVLAGGKGWNDAPILALIAKLQHSGENILPIGYVPEGDLPALYSGATVFVFPSFYEGFGMPPLEAMACGAPVIASNTSSLPEVVGDAGLLVDPHDVAQISDTMQAVLINPKLQQKLRRQGLLQAKTFNWDRSAQKIADVVKELGRS